MITINCYNSINISDMYPYVYLATTEVKLYESIVRVCLHQQSCTLKY